MRRKKNVKTVNLTEINILNNSSSRIGIQARKKLKIIFF
jgi:hypothetical protein